MRQNKHLGISKIDWLYASTFFLSSSGLDEATVVLFPASELGSVCKTDVDPMSNS